MKIQSRSFAVFTVLVGGGMLSLSPASLALCSLLLWLLGQDKSSRMRSDSRRRYAGSRSGLGVGLGWVARGRATERMKAGSDDIELAGSRSSTNNGGNGGLAAQHERHRLKAAEQSRSKQKQSSARE